MDTADTERERQRLAQLYASMTDGELRQVAADMLSLTEVAQQALEDELERRSLDSDILDHPAPQVKPEQRPLVTVRQFRDLPEALLAKGMLDSAGIECYLADENMVRLDWFISNLLGGVKLKVREEDFGTALSVLNEPAPARFDVEGVGEYEQPRCPRCGSVELRHDAGLDKRFALPGLALGGIPIPLSRSQWKCQACNHHWSESPSTETDDDFENR